MSTPAPARCNRAVSRLTSGPVFGCRVGFGRATVGFGRLIRITGGSLGLGSDAAAIRFCLATSWNCPGGGAARRLARARFAIEGSELDCGRIDAEAQAGHRRTVVEDVSQMGTAAAAHHLDPRLEGTVVHRSSERPGVGGPIEAGPAGSGIELVLSVEELGIAANAEERAAEVAGRILAGECRLGRLLTSDHVLHPREDLPPFRIGLVDELRLGLALVFGRLWRRSQSRRRRLRMDRSRRLTCCSRPSWAIGLPAAGAVSSERFLARRSSRFLRGPRSMDPPKRTSAKHTP